MWKSDVRQIPSMWWALVMGTWTEWLDNCSASCRSIELSLRLWRKWIHINETHCVPNVSYTQMQMMANVYACEMNLFSVRQMVFSAFQL